MTQHEADQRESARCSATNAEATQCTQRTKIALLPGPRQQQQVWAIASAGGCSRCGEKIAAFQVAAWRSVALYHESRRRCRVKPAPRAVGRGEQQQAGPAHKNETVALEPVIEDVNHPRAARAALEQSSWISYERLYKTHLSGRWEATAAERALISPDGKGHRRQRPQLSPGTTTKARRPAIRQSASGLSFFPVYVVELSLNSVPLRFFCAAQETG